MNALTLTDALRHSIGLDPFARFAEQAASRTTNYPPYNIEQYDEDRYLLTLAVAGFSRDDVIVTLKDRTLTVTGTKPQVEDHRTFLHRGIATRDFVRQFHLGEHVEVTEAQLDSGILVIALDRRVPETAKPKVIPIG
jgi:molecular chaperone IbpA